MVEFLDGITFWYWLILGVGMLLLEMLAPGVVFLWLGIAAGITGVVAFSIDTLVWQNQAIIFAVLSVVAVIAGRAWLKQRPVVTDHPTLNQRGAQYVGKSFVLKEAIVDGEGVIVVDDTTWKVRGTDAPAGSRIKITETDGSAFLTEPA